MSSSSVSLIENTCESCIQKELCPVYMGEHCSLVREHEEEVGIIGSD